MKPLREHETIAELMNQRGIGFMEFVDSTGVDPEVVSAMVDQRYTPSPEQRRRVSGRLGVRIEQIVWGHKNLVEEYIHAPI